MAPEDEAERITIDANVLVGKPVVRGTRLSVEFILDLLAQGWSHPEILAEHPGLDEADLLACLAYARELVKDEKIYRLGA